MDIIAIMATDLNLIGKLIYNVLYRWVSDWAGGGLLGAFSVTVILFTLFLKAATSPFDVWQKSIARKNSKIMEEMKPHLDKITKQCGNNRELLMQKQRALYKQYKYSTFASCLPMLITLVIFLTVFAGFNSAVRYHNSKSFDELSLAYTQGYQDKIQLLIDDGRVIKMEDGTVVPTEASDEQDIKKELILAAEQAVLDEYKPEKFLLTKNIFMPDTWATPVPTAEVFTGSSIGKLGIKGVDAIQYNKVMRPLLSKYNFTDEGKKAWNGYLILPILAFVLNLLSTKLNKPPEQPQMLGQTEEQKKAQAAQTKMLTYMMPIMMTIFTFLYSTAFALYMFMNSLITTVFNLVYNIIAKRKDDKERDYILSTTIKK